jgi:hypothetical protein
MDGLVSDYGVAAPPFSRGPYRWNQRVNFTAGISGTNVQQYRGANVWYVDKTNCTVTGDGKSWESAFLTLTEAVAVAGDYDYIFIGPGFYTEVATQTITQVGLKIIGCNTSGKTRGPCALKGPSGGVTTPIITVAVNANDVEICNLGFIATGAGKAIQLGGAASGYVWRTHIHDCAFFGDSTGTYAIAVYGATTTPSAGAFPDVAECVVEGCHFYAWTTACTCVYGTRVLLRGNTMFVPDSGIGIVHGAGRPFAEISRNIIHGTGTSTALAITGNDDSAVIVTDNTLNGCSTLITDKVSDGGVAGNNWTYGGLATASVVDPTA